MASYPENICKGILIRPSMPKKKYETGAAGMMRMSVRSSYDSSEDKNHIYRARSTYKHIDESGDEGPHLAPFSTPVSKSLELQASQNPARSLIDILASCCVAGTPLPAAALTSGCNDDDCDYLRCPGAPRKSKLRRICRITRQDSSDRCEAFSPRKLDFSGDGF